LKHGPEVLAPNLEDGLVGVDFATADDEAHVSRLGIVEGLTQGVADRGPALCA